MNSYSFYLKNGSLEIFWTNALHIMCELNVKNHNRGMNCVCLKEAAEDQVDITDKLCMRTGAWFMPANFIEMSNLSRHTMFLPGVKLSGPAVKALIGTFPRQKYDWNMPSFICVCTKCTMHCRLVQSLHRTLCMISLMKGNVDCCTYNHCAELYQVQISAL